MKQVITEGTEFLKRLPILAELQKQMFLQIETAT